MVESRMPPDLVAHFLKNIRGSVPLAIEQIDIMLRLIGAARDPVARFLDLGCGDAVISAAILDEYPAAKGTLIELTPALLQTARHRLQSHTDRVTFVATDLCSPNWIERIRNAAPFDAIVSGFAINHLADDRKRAFYGELLPL